MYTLIKEYCDSLVNTFNLIPAERKEILEKTAAYIMQKQQSGLSVNLVYICTHNSRRSHFGQVWAAVAARYYNVSHIHSFSGGTEATAFNPHAIEALQRTGFIIEPGNEQTNNFYDVYFDEKSVPLQCFSKVYNHEKNPATDFAAIMMCSDAEENCPYIPGAEFRIATTYDDPKAHDGTTIQDTMYDACCRQIAVETLYIFSIVNAK